jgi:hypothetical protein
MLQIVDNFLRRVRLVFALHLSFAVSVNVRVSYPKHHV